MGKQAPDWYKEFMRTISMNVHGTPYDKEYGRLDFAPRVLGLCPGNDGCGYLLSWNPVENTFAIRWDDKIEIEYLRQGEFTIIGGLVY